MMVRLGVSVTVFSVVAIAFGVGYWSNGRYQPPLPGPGDALVGTWTTDPDFTGTHLTLEARGQGVQGSGRFWGCVGGISFVVHGELNAEGVLRLEFADEHGVIGIRNYRLFLQELVSVDVSPVRAPGTMSVSRDVYSDLNKLDFLQRPRRP